MKTTSIINRIIIFLAFNIHIITAFIFAMSFVIAVISHILFTQIPLVVSYFFWFSFGLFVFSTAIRNANYFLGKKYEARNEYYLNLLEKSKKHMSGKR